MTLLLGLVVPASPLMVLQVMTARLKSLCLRLVVAVGVTLTIKCPLAVPVVGVVLPCLVERQAVQVLLGKGTMALPFQMATMLVAVEAQVL
jgi:hypothetical protein